MTNRKDEDMTTETDFRVLDVTKTLTKETVPAVDLRALPADAEKATAVDVDLRRVVVPVTVPADPDAATAIVDDDATVVDAVRPLPPLTPSQTVTEGSAPMVLRLKLDEQ